MIIDPDALQYSTATIAPGMWIGGAYAPIPEDAHGVVTLDNLAPPVLDPAVRESRAPFPDSRFQPVPLGPMSAALAAADTYRAHGVLIRCRHGLNRSALIAALTLRNHGDSAHRAMEQIRSKRPGALSNPYFADLIAHWPNDPMRAQR